MNSGTVEDVSKIDEGETIFMSKKTNAVHILLSDGKQYYKFLQVTQTNDGSVECVFPDITPNKKNIAQVLEIDTHNKETPIIRETKSYTPFKDPSMYISYHTSGYVNYHRLTFDPMYMEPLSEVTKLNPFFILSFQELSAFSPFADGIEPAMNEPYIDIRELLGHRIDIVFSIGPGDFLPNSSSLQLVLNYNSLFCLIVEVLNDENTFQFSKIYEPQDCVKFRPHLDMFTKLPYTKNEAILKYVHKLFCNENVVILPPSKEGFFKMYFTVEMRRPPWIKIEFSNPNLEINIRKRTTIELQFEIYDRAKNQWLKSAKDVQITNLLLDANIYEDESIPPDGLI